MSTEVIKPETNPIFLLCFALVYLMGLTTMDTQRTTYKQLIDGFVFLARELNESDIGDDVEWLRAAFDALVLNARLMVSAVPDALRLTGFAEGFGLMIYKTPAWRSDAVKTVPKPISETEQDRLREHLGRVLGAILPNDGSGLYQHFETEDGLICALFRLEDEWRISIAAFDGQDVRQVRFLH